MKPQQPVPAFGMTGANSYPYFCVYNYKYGGDEERAGLNVIKDVFPGLFSFFWEKAFLLSARNEYGVKWFAITGFATKSHE